MLLVHRIPIYGCLPLYFSIDGGQFLAGTIKNDSCREIRSAFDVEQETPVKNTIHSKNSQRVTGSRP